MGLFITALVIPVPAESPRAKLEQLNEFAIQRWGIRWVNLPTMWTNWGWHAHNWSLVTPDTYNLRTDVTDESQALDPTTTLKREEACCTGCHV